MAGQQSAPQSAGQAPTEALKEALQELLKTVGQRAMQSVTSKVGSIGKEAGKKAVKDVGGKVVQETGGKVAGQAKGAAEAVGLGGGDGKGSQGGKVTNIVEEIDVGVPVTVAYDQWTRFTDFPGFMKKVESVEQPSDTELKWRGQILWSHRDWKSTIVDQVPDERIIWRSEGSKGYVDGAVTFHELSPNLTKILLILEYYPNGFFEKTGNLWRAQGRRARLELKHFQRHVMTQTILHQDEVEGWRGVIHDSEVQESQESGETEESQNGES